MLIICIILLIKIKNIICFLYELYFEIENWLFKL
jgi:hypothetical protein